MGRDSKHERFVRLANARVNAALKALELVGNLSNHANYEYDDQEASKIVKVLREQVEDVKSKFANGAGKSRFTL